jgi:hypothetical protein
VLPDEPLPAGSIGKPVPVQAREYAQLVALAARQAAATAALGRVPAPDEQLPRVVVWEEGGASLAVGVAGLAVDVGEGLIRVSFPVFCDQLEGRRAAVRVTFAVGAPGRPTGLLAATPREPEGPRVVVEPWSEQLIALAWQAILDSAGAIAAETGTDTDGTPLVVTALTAGPDGLQLVPQARHSFDRVLRGRAVTP